MERPDGEGTLENPIQLGAEGAMPWLKLLRLNLSGKRTEIIGTMPVFPSSLFLSIVF